MPSHCSRVGAAFVAVLSVVASPLVAAEFRSEPVDATLARQRQIAIQFAKNPDNSRRQAFNDYLSKYHFPAMTRPDPASLAELGALRFDLFSKLIWPAADQVQTEVTKQALAFATSVVRRNAEYHPAVVYNAVLVLGGLDRSYAIDKGPEARAASPLPEANTILCQIVAAGLQSKLPPSMLVGALVGLERHARAFESLDLASKKRTGEALLAVLNHQKFQTSVDPKVVGWMRMQAVLALANIGLSGPNGSILSAVASQVSSMELPLSERCRCAALLAKFKMDGVPPEVGQSIAEAIARLTIEVAKYEDEQATEFTDVRAGSSRQRLSNKAYPRYKYDPELADAIYLRQGMIEQAVDLQTGLNAVAPIAGDRAESIKKVSNELKALIEFSKIEDDNGDLDVVSEIQEFATTAKSVLKPTLDGAKPGAQDAEAAEAAAIANPL